jgi:uncharacterized membrane protein YhaH (DUF805 family)
MNAPPVEETSPAISEPIKREVSFFSASGRIGRLQYVLLLCFFFVWGNGGTITLAQLPRAETRFATGLFLLVGLVFWTVAAVSVTALGIQRLHDLNRSGWFLLLYLVPIVNIGFLLLLSPKGSSPAPNRYGKRGSG